MGCTASKLDNEDTVRRCKERRRLIKDAVFARHHLAAAHADYCRSLRHTGVALSDFASGEPLLVVSPSTPSVLLPHHHQVPKSPFSLSSNYHSTPHPIPPPIKTHHLHHPPSPPPPPFSPTIASSKMPPILSASNSVKRTNTNQKLNENNNNNTFNNNSVNTYHNSVNARNFFSNSVAEGCNTNNNVMSTKKGMKLPHILSDSSVSSSTPRSKFDFMAENNHTTYVGVPNTNYCSTPSQASSVWNWDNFYPPPSPPDSDFFRNQNQREDGVFSHIHHHHHHQQQEQGQNGHFGVGGGEEESEREEVHCSEWGDHYSSTTSSSSDDNDDDDGNDVDHGEGGGGGGVDGDDERDSRSEISELRTRSRSQFGSSSVRSEAVGPPPPLKKVEERSEDGASSSKSWKNNGREMCGSDEMRIVVRHKDLQEIVNSLKEYFDKAAEAGDQVSEMLETGRAQLDRSFRQLKKTVYHSSGVLSSLSSSWTSKPPLAVKYRLDTSALDAPGGSKSLCSTLERLLAWEKKLYEEVKAREGVKIEHEKKLATLQNQEYKGDEVKLDKTKASIKKLQSLIIVTSQAVNTTSSAIVGLRDSDLIPQLVELCHGMMYMWRTMNQYHEVQNQIVQQVRGLVNRLVKGESTSELHRQATRDLESAVSAWHSSFCRLIKFQRDFVRSLHGWFKLTLLPVEKETTNMIPEASDAYPFFDEWKNSLDRLPDTVTSEAIKSFINVVHVISMKQTEEFKIQKRTETISKELEKKASNLRTLEKKYYNSYSMVGIGMPDAGPDNGHILDARDPLVEKKAELQVCQRRVEDEMMKHSKAVEVTKAMTLNNIQTGLPGVFQSLTSFSSLFMEGLEAVCYRSYAIK